MRQEKTEVNFNINTNLTIYHVHLGVHDISAIRNCFTKMEINQFEAKYPPLHPPCPLVQGGKQVLLVLPLQLLYHRLLIINPSN